MINEVILDIYPFIGHEDVVELIDEKPLLEGAIKKRAKNYKTVNFKSLDKLIKADLVICPLLTKDYISDLGSKFWECFLSETKFLLICPNNKSFHNLCNFIETGRKKDGIDCNALEKKFPQDFVFESFYGFQSVSDPCIINSRNLKLKNYLLSRSGRVNEKRQFKKCCSVLLELILIKNFSLNYFYPFQIYMGKLC